jgi:copper chaperone CopZ
VTLITENERNQVEEAIRKLYASLDVYINFDDIDIEVIEATDSILEIVGSGKKSEDLIEE